ncbi:hypothetical protein QQS21_000092 [Conoideocrella luteorostrata]|uniref:Zn(2)-C6 fungal-type domain-containing protein n=1 Tax=Conoideocrella luteorostrata TaxID=1105319 RepID=A0AAJ0G4A8_9HYPO|nr:hypothetical protein QQS21_000092 [Conoideocrella luteorostrata]
MPADPHLSPVIGAPRRKNGRQQACEPCRRRKVACDHRLPVCSRCKRGGVSERCVYLTLRRPSPASPVLSPSNSSPVAAKISEVVSNATDETPPRSDGSTGYLGATSFSAFYQETQGDLVSEHQKLCGQPQCSTCVGNDTASHGRSLAKLAMSTLKCIPDMASAEALIDVESSAHDGWSRLVGERLHASFWAAFESHLAIAGGRDEPRILQMASKISDNTSRPFKDDQTDPVEWLKSFSGPEMRWESLGHLFIYWAYGARGIRDSCYSTKCVDLRKRDSLELLRTYKQCALWCIELSRAATTDNMLLAYLVFKHCLIESQVSGETGRLFWRLHGDIISLVTFIGLHAPYSTAPTDRSISVQMGRRLFAVVFSHDKTVATFTGRPTFLSRRFVSTPLPLDIDDHELLGDAKPEGTPSCDAGNNGWNAQGGVYGVTFPRARAMLAFIRDEILELALQTQQYSDMSTLPNLKHREMQLVAEFPLAIRYTPEDLNCRPASTKKKDISNKLRIWLEHLQNLFLIERLLSKNANKRVTPELFGISLEMISLALLLWTHQKRLNYPEACLDWLVMSYAAPAGGVLCMELLRGNNVSAASKATIIEKLSMLASFLDWVSPSAPNHCICKGVQQAVRRTIEQSLETTAPGAAAAAANAVENASVDVNTDGLVDFDTIFNFDLLDTFEWLRPDGADWGVSSR